ncbi:MAG: PEP/pyruvate-binding domain-containing protein, partial [Acidimicrobiia bacterium]
PAVVGAKAASLARARQLGLPVLDGFALSVEASRPALAGGAQALAESNSGRARATVTGGSLDPVLTSVLAASAANAGSRLVVRSSAPFEGDGAWAGALASYAGMAPDEVALGVLGCWASVYAPDPIERARATGVDPAVSGVAVLVQREIDPEYGGVATVAASGTVTIVAIAGPPVAIVSGWERGHVIVVEGGGAEPAEAVDAIGPGVVDEVAGLAREVAARIGCHHIEWAYSEGQTWLLQAQPRPPAPTRSHTQPPQPSQTAESDYPDPAELVRLAEEEASRKGSAGRFGLTRSEPALYEAVSALGVRHTGTPAAGGWGAGRIHFVRDGDDAARGRPRQIVASVYPLNNLAPLLWDAAGLVTTGGSPGAHLFEVAAWLGVPALCGVDLEAAAGISLAELTESTRLVGAIDGDGGTLTLLEAAL